MLSSLSPTEGETWVISADNLAIITAPVGHKLNRWSTLDKLLRGTQQHDCARVASEASDALQILEKEIWEEVHAKGGKNQGIRLGDLDPAAFMFRFTEATPKKVEAIAVRVTKASRTTSVSFS